MNLLLLAGLAAGVLLAICLAALWLARFNGKLSRLYPVAGQEPGQMDETEGKLDHD